MPRWLLAVAFLIACRDDHGKSAPRQLAPRDAQVSHGEVDPYIGQRNWMVDHTIVDRGIHDPRVIAAMRITPRDRFVPPAIRDQAYDDRALPIGFESTISQPYIIALMTDAAHVKAGDKVLEVGTGSGYQAAVLAMMGAKVYTMEIREPLATRTKDVLKAAGFGQVTLKTGDGYFGLPDEAPFNAIIVTCAAADVPKPLIAQLAVGGRLVMPLGDTAQAIMAITRTPNGTTREIVMDGVAFGPMTGEIESPQ